MHDTWDARDYRVLEAAVRLLDADELFVGPRAQEIANDTGLGLDDVIRALQALDGYLLEMSWVIPAHAARVVGVAPEARVAVGQWPSPERAGERLIEALQHLAESEPDEAKRGKIRVALEAITSAGRDFAIELGAAVVGRTITGS